MGSMFDPLQLRAAHYFYSWTQIGGRIVLMQKSVSRAIQRVSLLLFLALV